ncbi:MAG TPA: aldo/keto reductase, partial [Limnochordia bacterium]
LEVAARRGVAVINAAPYGSGILAKGPDAYARYAYQDAPAELVERTRRLAEVCRRYDVPLAAAALQFSLRDPRIAATIVGITRPERIEQTLALARQAIPDALWPELTPLAERAVDPEATRWRRPRPGADSAS